MPHHRLKQSTVNVACEQAYARYTRMPYREGNLHFSYELQGYIRWMVKDHCLTRPEAYAKVEDLLVMLEKANAEV